MRTFIEPIPVGPEAKYWLPRTDKAPQTRLKVVLPVLNFGAEETGVGRYTYEMAKHFAHCGHDVTVLCAPPYYPWWKVQEPHRAWKVCRETIEGIHVVRLPLYVPAQPTGLKRLLHLTSIAASMAAPALAATRNADLMWIAQPSLALAPGAILASRLWKSRLWMHVQDLEVAAAEKLGVLPRVVTDAICTVESYLYEKCHAVSTISQAMREQLETRTLHEIPVFPNWVDVNRIRPQDGSGYKAELGIPESTLVALYSGNMGEKQGLEIVVEAARLLQDRTDLLFVLAGQGATRARLEEMARGLSNVRFLPLQPSERMNDFLAFGDIHLVPQKAGVGDLVMPSKMGGILSAGRPVVATCEADDELGRIVKKCGIATLPGDAANFAQSVREMVESPEARKTLGAVGRLHAEKHLSDQAILPRMEQFLWKVAGIEQLA